tara:strand:- start:9190 stop:9321 length:132 start_codon:yes stop_codon:yes gene_type:complete
MQKQYLSVKKFWQTNFIYREFFLHDFPNTLYQKTESMVAPKEK